MSNKEGVGLLQQYRQVVRDLEAQIVYLEEQVTWRTARQALLETRVVALEAEQVALLAGTTKLEKS